MNDPHRSLCAAFALVLATVGPVVHAQTQPTNPAAARSDAGTPAPTHPTQALIANLTAFTDRPTYLAAAGQQDLIDFESIAAGTTLTTELQPFGIAAISGSSTHTPGPTTQHVMSSTAMPFTMFVPGTLPSETNFLCNDMASPTFATGEIVMLLTMPRRAVGAFVADQGPLGGFEIELRLLGIQLGSIAVPPRTLPASFIGVVSDIVFDEVHFRSVNQNDSWGLDDLQFARCSATAATFPQADPLARNAPNSIAESPAGNRPILGNSTFAIAVDDPGNACGLTGGAIVGLMVSGAPASIALAGFGCAGGATGEVMIDPASAVFIGLQPWSASPAVFPLPIPAVSAFCGASVFAQGFWLEPTSATAPGVLSWRLVLGLGL